MNKNTIKAPCTVLLAVVNVIVFLVLSFQGMTEDGRFMLQHGAMYVPYLIKNGEYYRLFTSMFLHFGYDHLFNNMVVLVAMGWNLELEIGKIKFLIVYFVSGLAGNILSAWWDIILWIYQWRRRQYGTHRRPGSRLPDGSITVPEA